MVEKRAVGSQDTHDTTGRQVVAPSKRPLQRLRQIMESSGLESQAETELLHENDVSDVDLLESFIRYGPDWMYKDDEGKWRCGKGNKTCITRYVQLLPDADLHVDAQAKLIHGIEKAKAALQTAVEAAAKVQAKEYGEDVERGGIIDPKEVEPVVELRADGRFVLHIGACGHH